MRGAAVAAVLLTSTPPPPPFFAAAGLLQSLGMDGSSEAEEEVAPEVDVEEGLKEVPLVVAAELTPFVRVMPKRFLTVDGLAAVVEGLVGFLGLGRVVGRFCLFGEGLERDEVVDETGESREVGSPTSSSSLKWMWVLLSPLASFLACAGAACCCCPGSTGPIKPGRFSSLLGRRGLRPDWPLGPRTRRGDEEAAVLPSLLLVEAGVPEELLPVVLAAAAYEADVAVLLAVLLIPF